MIIGSKEHNSLKESYEIRANETWLNNDFKEENLLSSLNLFENESINRKSPVPKKLEVFAVVSGLSFSTDLKNFVKDIQKKINGILGETLKYWVKEENLGVEYAVLKWPDQAITEGQVKQAINCLKQLQVSCPKKLFIKGLQINPDGCIVLRGYDDENFVSNIRSYIKNCLTFLPSRQSGWAHIPIGRILQPIGQEKFNSLKIFFESTGLLLSHEENISDLKLVHEKRWYMEDKEILFTKKFI